MPDEIVFPILQQQDVAYLDNAATSLAPRQVLDAMTEYECGYRANVARGIYPWAERATQAYEDSRARIAAGLDADPREIIFTSGATAALNLAAGLAGQLPQAQRQVLLTELDHHSNIIPWQLRFGRERKIAWASCDSSGRLDTESVCARIAAGDIGIACVPHASNVTGQIVDIAAIARVAARTDTLLVVDGAQFVPHDLPRLRSSGADFYAFSGHKCNGPTGIGVLWARGALLDGLDPVSGGGGMVAQVGQQDTTFLESPHRFEPGTPAIAAAIGLGAAFKLRSELMAAGTWERIQARVSQLDGQLRETLAGMRHVQLLGGRPDGDRIAVTSFNLDDAHPHDVCQILGEEGVCIRGGHHCAQPLMARLGVAACCRASLGPHVDRPDIERLARALEKSARTLR